jgi:DNA-binding NarL/FixJ family response regulator
MEDFFGQEITIIIADDHELVRSGIKRVLFYEKSLKIIDEASNGEDAVRLAKYHKPNVMLLDIFMPKMNGIEAAEIIKREVPDTFVVMLTAFEDAHHLEQALSAGADGYLAKDISAKDLIESIKNVTLGERVFSKSILHIMQNKYIPSDVDSSPVSISKREQEILNMVAMGKTSQEIADKYNISIRTVQSHRSNIMQKLGLKSAGSLVRYAVLHNTKD